MFANGMSNERKKYCTVKKKKSKSDEFFGSMWKKVLYIYAKNGQTLLDKLI